MIIWRLLALPLLISTVLQCSAIQQFQVRGLLLKFDPDHGAMLVSQEDIPGYMEAMTMSYRVHSGQELASIKPGSRIEFTLTIGDEATSVSNIHLLQYASVEREPLAAQSLALLEDTLRGTTRPRRKIQIGEQVPDFTLVDQTAKRVSLYQFSGKLICVTFIYTRCPLPDYCLRLSNNFGRLQKRFPGHMGNDLILLSITFDPAHDTPEVLARYSQIWKADPENWRLLTGPPDEVKRICNLLGSNFWPDEGTLTHSLHTLIIDKKGKLAADIEGNQFTADQLGDLVQTYFK
jgi:protein SCO1/2